MRNQAEFQQCHNRFGGMWHLSAISPLPCFHFSLLTLGNFVITISLPSEVRRLNFKADMDSLQSILKRLSLSPLSLLLSVPHKLFFISLKRSVAYRIKALQERSFSIMQHTHLDWLWFTWGRVKRSDSNPLSNCSKTFMWITCCNIPFISMAANKNSASIS